MSTLRNEIVRKEIDRMLLAGIITPWSLHVHHRSLLQQKRQTFPVLCCLSKVRFGNARRPFALTRVDEIHGNMRGSSVSTTIDLFRGNCQIKMDETCK